jgi:hypothetical protein
MLERDDREEVVGIVACGALQALRVLRAEVAVEEGVLRPAGWKTTGVSN